MLWWLSKVAYLGNQEEQRRHKRSPGEKASGGQAGLKTNGGRVAMKACGGYSANNKGAANGGIQCPPSPLSLSGPCSPRGGSRKALREWFQQSAKPCKQAGFGELPGGQIDKRRPEAATQFIVWGRRQPA
eukprot:EG_transcript_41510